MKLTLLMMVVSYFTTIQANNLTGWSFTLVCPGDRYASCYDELWDLSQYGNAYIHSGYSNYSAGQPTVTYHLNSCNTGYITRTWSVEDYNWNWHTCTQTIYVNSTGNYGPDIIWPRDTTLVGCNPGYSPQDLMEGYNYPSWTGNECSMYGRSYSDMVFKTSSNQCKKIMRTWKVMDWCNENPYGYGGIYSHIQIIKIVANTPPSFDCPSDVTVLSNNCQNAEVLLPPLEVPSSSCGGYFIISHDSKYATQKGNNISGIYPVGKTKVTYTVQYGCGLVKTCSFNVNVQSGKPTPYCTGELVTALMGVDTDYDGKVDNGMVELWAKDFNRGSYSKCVGGTLRFSFSPDVNDMKRSFTCDDLGENQVDIYVTDASGAQSFCTTTIIIQNNGANIPDCKRKETEPEKPKYIIQGTVSAINDLPVKGAEVTLTYDVPQYTYHITYDTVTRLTLDSFINASGHKLYRYIEIKEVTEHKDSVAQILTKSIFTSAAGSFTFDSFNITDVSFTLEANFTGDKSKNLNVFDVEMLRNYLDGSNTYQSYYQYLASDINEDGIIDDSDLELLENFVMGSTSALPGKHQWYVIPNSTAFTYPDDVLQYQNWSTKYHLDSIKIYDNIYNFIAIKKGDISIDPDSKPIQEIEIRNSNLNTHPVIQVFPNPVTDFISINSSTTLNESMNIEIYSHQGQCIVKQKTDLKHIEISTSHWLQGMYLYRIKVGERIYSGKILKQ
ncbi:MAG: T9SS type A sorting domain-containing protein [Saprospiraceae bacterium]